MCYHVALDAEIQAVQARLNREFQRDIRMDLPIYHATAFARPYWPAVKAEEPTVISSLRWGLIPKWARGDKEADFLRRSPTFNAISEEMYDKRSFQQSAIAGRRCLLPITGFFEWQHRGKDKVPHYIKLRGEQIFCLGGIYETDGSFSICTAPANSLMATIHNSKKRMPVIIPKSFENDWLSQSLTKDDVAQFCNAVHEIDLDAWTITKRITDRKLDPNVKEVVEAADYGPYEPGSEEEKEKNDLFS